MYYTYYNKAPKYVGYQYIIQNSKAKQYFQENPQVLKEFYTKEELAACENYRHTNRINKIHKRGEYLPIQHYNAFRQYTYTYNLALLVDNSMPKLIEFAYNQFNKYCIKYIAITLVIKHKEKIKYEQMKRKKKKPVYPDNAPESRGSTHENPTKSKNDKIKEEPLSQDDSAYMNDDQEMIDMVYDQLESQKIDENHPLVGNYLKYDIEELKMKLKEPSVLLKFYQAWLFECDWEQLFDFLEKQLATEFYYAAMMKLLLYLIWNVVKLTCISPQKNSHNKNLSTMLQNYMYNDVIDQLKTWTRMYKYSEYELAGQDINSNIRAHDLKSFKDLARNTSDIYMHLISNPVSFTIKEMEFDNIGIIIKIVEYTNDNFNKHTFDLLSVTHTYNNYKFDLSKTSWKLRLEKLKEIFIAAGQPNLITSIITVHPIEIRKIQFDNLPCSGTTVCHYIRTSGQGSGTLFYRTKNRRVRNGNSYNQPSKRFRKITIQDLILKKIPKNVNIEMPESQAQETKFNPLATNSLSSVVPHKTFIDYIMERLTTLNSSASYPLISTNQDPGRGTFSPPLLPPLIQQSASQLDHNQSPLTSPIPSPDHNISEEYIGSILRANGGNLAFAEFNKDDYV